MNNKKERVEELTWARSSSSRSLLLKWFRRFTHLWNSFSLLMPYFVTLKQRKAQIWPGRQDIKSEDIVYVRRKLKFHAPRISRRAVELQRRINCFVLAALSLRLHALYRYGTVQFQGNLKFYSNGEIRALDYREEKLINLRGKIEKYFMG